MENNAYLKPPFSEPATSATTATGDETQISEKSIPTTLVDIPLKTVFMRKLGKDITKQEIIDLFGLHKTTFLKDHTRIGLVHGREDNTAIVEVAEKVYDELVKLSGMKYKGSDIILSPHEDPSRDEQMETDGAVEEGEDAVV